MAQDPMDQVEEEANLMASYDAFRSSNLKIGIRNEGMNPFGYEDLDWYVYNILLCAGITVELLHEDPGGVEQSKYEFVQIVDEIDQRQAARLKDLKDLKFHDTEDQLGVQVKLNGAHKWRLTIADENLEHHHVGSSNRSRRASATAAKTSYFENKNIFEVAVPIGDTMQCTVAIATAMTISIAFQTEQLDHNVLGAVWTNDVPLISQRRIDCVFTNEFLVTTQVRVP